MTTTVNPVPLDAIVRTDELAARPSRAPGHAVQSQALQSLAHALADDPHGFARHLATTVMQTLQAGSAGISVQVAGADGTRFQWSALAGAWQAHAGSHMPGDFSLCADAQKIGGPVLFVHPERRYGDMAAFVPPMTEGLLVPLRVEGVVTGAMCAMAHDEQRRFDAEDLRLLQALGQFAACAWRVVAALSALEARLRAPRLDLAAVAASPGRRILVVDDNEDAAASMAAFLQMDRHVTQVAHTGPEAMQAVASFRPDVVLLDLDLPHMSGYEVARSIRARPDGAGVLLVALTGWSRNEDRDQTRQAGFDAHLVKPADLAELARLIGSCRPRPPV